MIEKKVQFTKKVELFWPHQLLKVFISNVVVNIVEHSTLRGNGEVVGGEMGGEGLPTQQGLVYFLDWVYCVVNINLYWTLIDQS